MVIDSVKGVEPHTRKLMEVCRMRNTPILTFINKLDREGRDPLDLLADIEEKLQIGCAPLSWPIGMGKRFKGTYNPCRNELYLFTPGEERPTDGMVTIRDLSDPLLDERLGGRAEELRGDMALLEGASNPFVPKEYLKGNRPLFSNDFILGAVGVLQFDVRLARLKAEYNVDAVDESVDYATARRVGSAEPKRLETFRKANQDNLALDAEGNPTYLAAREWRLQFAMEKRPGIDFLKTREHDGIPVTSFPSPFDTVVWYGVHLIFRSRMEDLRWF